MAAVVAQWKRNLMMLSAGILFTPLQIRILEVATRITGYIQDLELFFVSEERLEVMLHLFCFVSLFVLLEVFAFLGWFLVLVLILADSKSKGYTM